MIHLAQAAIGGGLFENPYLLAIVLYLVALVGVGLKKARAVKGGEDFMVAGRSLPWPILVGTLLATWIGSGSLFSGAGLGYRNGFAGLWSSGGAWVGIILVAFIARRIRNTRAVTVPQVLESRYGAGASIIAMVITVIAYLTIVSYQFKGGGKVLSIISDGAVSMEQGIVVTAVFAVLYTVLAGMLSVVYTDVVNGALMSIGCLVSVVYLTVQVGGMDEVLASAEAAGKWGLFAHWAAESDTGASGPIVAISFFVPLMLLLLGDANMYQRIFSAKNAGGARKAIVFWVLGVFVLETVINQLGLLGSVAAEQGLMSDLGAATAGGGDLTENVIPTLAVEVLPTGLGMLLVATLMAVIVSTADSFLLIPATNLTRDLYQRYLHKDATDRIVILVSRLMVLALGGVAFLLVNQFPTVLEAAFTAYLMYGASITPALLGAFLWRRATGTGALCSMVGGAGVVILWTFVLEPEKWGSPFLAEPTYPAVVVSVAGLVLGSLLTRAPAEEVVRPFFLERDD